MRSSTARFLVGAILISCFALPPGLSAKSKRGSDLVVTRLDGSQVSGELIAVKPDSLLLYLPYQGREESVDKADIRSIRIRRKSGAGKGALYGGLGGLGTGILLGSIFGRIDEFNSGAATAAGIGLSMGIMGALGGLVLGSLRGVDVDQTVAGRPEETVAEYYHQLQKHARVGTPSVSSPAVRKPPALGPVG
jgi:hypothetical protein